ncbi:hypothetical protein GCM10009733_050420 [Nonomuraea maheshkhaliensis]|uniref:Uncharacterized protein n=1 Tax=Nonomuraea maheshkhaliensis TaxID=419590 RepID=A0ABN2FJ17_9ACTN
MQAPYDTGLAADVFAEAKNTFNWLIGQLTDAASGMLTHDRLEETIVEQGRELQRQLLRAHLDLRALRERQQAHHARQDAARRTDRSRAVGRAGRTRAPRADPGGYAARRAQAAARLKVTGWRCTTSTVVPPGTSRQSRTSGAGVTGTGPPRVAGSAEPTPSAAPPGAGRRRLPGTGQFSIFPPPPPQLLITRR